MTATTDLTDYLSRTFGATVRGATPLHWTPHEAIPDLGSGPAAVNAVAAILRADLQTNVLRLGGWLGTPDGRIFAIAVRAMIPPPAQPFEQILMQALVQVAAEQADRQRRCALLAVAVCAAGVLLAVLLRSA